MAIRRLLQNPWNILIPFIQEGMTVLDIGCGPGFFSLDMAHLVGPSGRVVAVDLQQGMLTKVREKIKGTGLEDRLSLHQCNERKIGLSERIDFALAFYVVHEIPDKVAFFREITTLLKPEGSILIVEPHFHVSRTDFIKTLQIAESTGLAATKGPKVFFSKTAILKKIGKGI